MLDKDVAGELTPYIKNIFSVKHKGLELVFFRHSICYVAHYSGYKLTKKEYFIVNLKNL